MAKRGLTKTQARQATQIYWQTLPDRNESKASIDLHGLTVQEGFNETARFISLHFSRQTSVVKIITGRSGKMYAEFEHWMDHFSISPMVRSFKSNKGSWTVKLRLK